MSAWRRTALEALPDFRVLIERANSPMALWIVRFAVANLDF
jgi:hypothetical protein